MGKTRTAIEYAHQFAAEYSALLLVRADSPETLRRNLADLTGVLKLAESKEPDPEARLAAALDWLAAHPRWLLILDNVDTDAAAAEVERTLGRLRGGHVIITTRISNWSAQVQPLDLKVLDRAASVDFLRARTDGYRLPEPTDEADLLTLATELDGLALALEQAGAFIQVKRLSLGAYLRRWREERRQVLDWVDEQRMHSPESVAVTWATTFKELGEPARALLGLLSYLAPAPIPHGLLETPTAPGILARAWRGDADIPAGGGSLSTVEDAFGELAKYALASPLTEPAGTFTIHRLVQEIVRFRLEGKAGEPGAFSGHTRWELTLVLVAAYAPAGGQDPATWPRWTILTRHVESLLEKAGGQHDPEPSPQLANNFANFLLSHDAAYHSAEPLHRRALAASERTLGPEHPQTLTSVNNLADLLRAKGDLAGAEPLFHRALEAQERTLGSEHPDTLTSLHNLAYLLQSKGDSAGAEPLYVRALIASMRVLGPEHPDTLLSLSGLATLLESKGDFARAEPLSRHVVDASERTLGPEHPQTLTSVNNLANLLESKGDLAGAEPLFHRALEAQERTLGSEHPDTLTSVNNLASLLENKGDRAGAEPLFRRALEASARTLGTYHPTTQLFQGNWEYCRALMNQSLGVRGPSNG